MRDVFAYLIHFMNSRDDVPILGSTLNAFDKGNILLQLSKESYQDKWMDLLITPLLSCLHDYELT